MSTITDSDLLTRFAQLPNPVKAEVVEYIDKRLDDKTQPKKPRKGGWAKGMIIVHDDFDEPLEDFKEYME